LPLDAGDCIRFLPDFRYTPGDERPFWPTHIQNLAGFWSLQGVPELVAGKFGHE